MCGRYGIGSKYKMPSSLQPGDSFQVEFHHLPEADTPKNPGNWNAEKGKKLKRIRKLDILVYCVFKRICYA